MDTLLHTRRKRNRQPSRVVQQVPSQQQPVDTQDSVFLSSQPDHLRCPPALIQQCRTGYTRLINIAQFQQDYRDYQQQLHHISSPPPSSSSSQFSVSDLHLSLPSVCIQHGIDSEVDAIGVWLHEAVAAESALLNRIKREAKNQSKENRKRRYKRKREQLQLPYKPKREPETKTEEESTSIELKEEVSRGEEKREVKDRRLRRARGVLKGGLSSSLSCISTASSPHHVSATLTLPETFGEQVASYQQLIQPLKQVTERSQSAATALPTLIPNGPSVNQDASTTIASATGSSGTMTDHLPALPPSLFASVRDVNTLTPDAFTYQYQTKLNKLPQSKAEQAEGAVVTAADLLPDDAALLRIAVYGPHSSRLQCEILVHAQQTLSELVDLIECSHKHIKHNHQSDLAQEDSRCTAASDCLFIEQTLYTHPCSHTHKPDFACHTTALLDWLQRDHHYASTGLSLYSTADLHTTRFADLSVRLGSHYLYRHADDCMHTIIVTDLRIIHPIYDVQQAGAYPLLVCRTAMRRHKCHICQVCTAVYVLYNDLLLHTNPSFVCATCYQLLHYDAQGQLMYADFKVYELLED